MTTQVYTNWYTKTAFTQPSLPYRRKVTSLIAGKTTRRRMADPNEIPSISDTAHFSLKWTWLTHRRCSPTPNSQASSGNRNVACILERKANESSASNCWKQPGTRESRAARHGTPSSGRPSQRKAESGQNHPYKREKAPEGLFGDAGALGAAQRSRKRLS